MATAIGCLAFSFSIFTGAAFFLATLEKAKGTSRRIWSWIELVPHTVVQQPAPKGLKKSPEIPFIGLILSPAAS
jgi:hypothetical protein